jgi:hypothetical protein
LDPLVENWSKEFNKVTKRKKSLEPFRPFLPPGAPLLTRFFFIVSNKEKLYKEFQHLNFENYQALEIAENVVDQFTGSDIIL